MNEKLAAGEHKYTFGAKQAGQPSGIYFMKLALNDKAYVVRIVELE